MQRMLLSEVEAREFLGIGRTFLWRLLASGDITSIKLGRRRLFPRAELEKFIAEETSRQREQQVEG